MPMAIGQLRAPRGARGSAQISAATFWAFAAATLLWARTRASSWRSSGSTPTRLTTRLVRPPRLAHSPLLLAPVLPAPVLPAPVLPATVPVAAFVPPPLPLPWPFAARLPQAVSIRRAARAATAIRGWYGQRIAVHLPWREPRPAARRHELVVA